MKVAISTDGDFVSAHFGRCEGYTIVEIENNSIIKKDLVSNPGHEPGFLPQFLREKGVDYIIAGGMGPRAVELFNQAGIKVVLGVTGRVDDVLDKFLKGELKEGESLCEH